jgi:SHS2 domain-containing protein
MYETFDHTADLGLRIRAGSLEQLFAEAGRALFSVIVDNFDDVRPVEEVQVAVAGTQTDYLLFDWLNELLYRFETEQRLFCDFQVQVTPAGLEARVRGERMDPRRHHMAHEVKAVTYHGLRVEQTDDGWCAEVILDI